MFDPLNVIEAAYRLDCPDDVWVRGVVDAAGPEIDHNLGYWGALYDQKSLAEHKFIAVYEVGMPANYEEHRSNVEAALKMLPPGAIEELLGSTICTTVSVAGGMLYEMLKSISAISGIHDYLSINAVDPSGQGCILSGYLPKTQRLPSAFCQKWERVAAHVAAGHRLRKRLRTAEDKVEAVLSPDGKVEHAQKEATSRAAQEMLSHAVRVVDKVRRRAGRSDPERALEEWKGLVAARWTLVDHFDSDGRRYLVARRNETDIPGLELLSLRERQAVGFAALGHTNKLIAYELGLSASTVGVLLHRAAQKLGVKTRAELIARFRQGTRS